VAVAKVDKSGVVKSVSIYKAPNSASTSGIASAISSTEFKAGRRDGEAVDMDYVLRAKSK